MEDRGYVYLLINPTMEGLIKIGKTNRSPEERANELSKATGVASPFVVVYKEFFENCTLAEAFVHTLLEQNNYRVSSNREFFSAPIDIGIKMIIEAKKNLSAGDYNSCTEDKFQTCNDQYTSDLVNDLFNKAFDLHYGCGNVLQDIDEAIVLYKKAYRLNSLIACQQLGLIYLRIESHSDPRQSLKYFKECVDGGLICCYVYLAEAYCIMNNKDNAIKCWNLYHKEVINNSNVLSKDDIIYNATYYISQVRDFCIPLLEKQFYIKLLPDIIKQYEATIEKYKKRNECSEHFECILHYAVHAISGKSLTPRHSGIVTMYKAKDGYGNIYNNNGNHMVNSGDILGDNRVLREGQNVTFGVVTMEDNFLRAHSIIIE